MSSFWTLNWKKLRYIISMILIVSVCLGLCSFLLVIRKQGIGGFGPSFLSMYGMFGVLIPLLILGLACFRSILRIRARICVFSRIPFSQLEKIGFKKSCTNKEERWKFSEELFEGVIGGFVVTCDIKDSRCRHISFFARARNLPFSTIVYYAVENYLEQQDIVSCRGGILKSYHIKSTRINSIDRLENELLEFTSHLQELGLKAT